MQDQEAVREFLIESNENLSQLSRELIELEQRPDDEKLIASIFRTIHTIKGTSGFFGFSILGSITHVAENILSQVRDKQRRLTPDLVSLILETADTVGTILTHIEADGAEGEDVHADLHRRLTEAHQMGAAPKTPQPEQKPAAVASTPEAKPNAAAASTPAAAATPASAPVAPKPAPPIAVTPVVPAVDTKAPETKVATPATPVAAAPAPPVHSPAASTLAESSEAAPAKSDVRPTPPAPETPARAESEVRAAKPTSINDSSIRVDVGLLDKLMNLVGELVLARNQILQVTNAQDATFTATSQHLNLITTELQESVMKTRLQPIGLVWDKLPRVVRDLSSSCGKKIQIEMDGAETELDKTIIEAIKDPLTHIVRNACDHGIETPEIRTRAGKSPSGKLMLRAYHEGGHVIIEIADDGAGINPEKIKALAITRGLVRPEQAKEMSEREALNLIFAPGFSTAEKVTSISGRGVGMDVVKTNIEKIGGIVDIHSTVGQGSMVRMKIPLTLAIIPALIVTSAGEHYAIPQVSLLELVRLEGEQAQKAIEMIQGAPVYRLRGHLLPLVYLRREFKLGGDSEPRTTVRSENTLDFNAARDKHRQWLDTLRQVLDGKITMSADEAAAHDQCLLGKWIYSTGLSEYSSIHEIHELEKVHRTFHATVKNVLVNKAKGDAVAAERELSELSRVSNQVLELLAAAESRTLELQNVNIVVLQADERRFGMVVEEINDTEEIVVKPLGKQLKSINMFAGSTIMGDGRVALILDVLGLAQRAQVVSESRDRASTDTKQGAEAAETRERKPVLLFQYGETGRMAIDLSAVARLEEFSADALEIAGDQETVQYRGQILPLIRLSQVLQTKHKAAHSQDGPLQVVVYSDKDRNVGLVVDRILDIVDESFVVEHRNGRKGIVGSAVIQKRVTDIVDVASLLPPVHVAQPANSQGD